MFANVTFVEVENFEYLKFDRYFAAYEIVTFTVAIHVKLSEDAGVISNERVSDINLLSRW